MNETIPKTHQILEYSGADERALVNGSEGNPPAAEQPHIADPAEWPAAVKERVQEDLIRQCIGCAANRGAAQEHGKVNVAAIASCAGMPGPLARAALQRLTTREEPIVAVNTEGPHLFKVLKAGTELSVEPLADCQEVRFRAPRALRPPEPKVRTRRKRVGVSSAGPRAQTQSRGDRLPGVSPMMTKFIAECCQGKGREAEVALAGVLREVLKQKLVAFEKTKNQPKPHPDTVERNGRYLTVGFELKDELPSMQLAILYKLGLSRIVYGKAMTYQEIRQELGMLPHDDLDAYIALSKWRRRQQQ